MYFIKKGDKASSLAVNFDRHQTNRIASENPAESHLAQGFFFKDVTSNIAYTSINYLM